MIDWSNEGGYRNHVLYEMCVAQPGHVDASVVSGKVELIGRAYSAAPSRGVTIDDFYNKLAEAIVENGSSLDKAIDDARRLGRISLAQIKSSVDAHRKLDEIVVKFIQYELGKGRGRGVRHRASFCSKYLHFHAPMAFPIYDTKVSAKLREMRQERKYLEPTRDAGLTGTYSNFCRNLVAYANQNHSADDWTPRSVDGELWGYPVLDTKI